MKADFMHFFSHCLVWVATAGVPQRCQPWRSTGGRHGSQSLGRQNGCNDLLRLARFWVAAALLLGPPVLTDVYVRLDAVAERRKDWSVAEKRLRDLLHLGAK